MNGESGGIRFKGSKTRPCQHATCLELTSGPLSLPERDATDNALEDWLVSGLINHPPEAGAVCKPDRVTPTKTWRIGSYRDLFIILLALVLEALLSMSSSESPANIF